MTAFNHLIYQIPDFIIRHIPVPYKGTYYSTNGIIEISLYHIHQIVATILLSFYKGIVDKSVVSCRFMT